jgi:hypothetical protein
MSATLLGVMAVIGALAVPIGTYLAVVRRTSGKIETTEAGKLWEEASKMREEYRAEADELRTIAQDLRAQNADLHRQNHDLAFRVLKIENGGEHE